MSDAHPDPLVTCLVGQDTPRVWSLLVTVFGELAQDEGVQIHGRTIGLLCEAIGIRPEAQRVALHRLRKEGWIQSERSGRQSLHSLTDRGRAMSVAASPRIYGTGPEPGTAWLSIRERVAGAGRAAFEGVWVDSNILISKQEPASSDTFTVAISDAMHLPDWMRHKVCPPELAEQSAKFASRLEACIDHLATRQHVSLLMSAVLRILVVHEWRRIVLKAPELPDHVYPGTWQGMVCRDRVQTLLAAFPRVSPGGLEGPGDAGATPRSG